jgi:hypothetical protein
VQLKHLQVTRVVPQFDPDSNDVAFHCSMYIAMLFSGVNSTDIVVYVMEPKQNNNCRRWKMRVETCAIQPYQLETKYYEQKQNTIS